MANHCSFFIYGADLIFKTNFIINQSAFTKCIRTQAPHAFHPTHNRLTMKFNLV